MNHPLGDDSAPGSPPTPPFAPRGACPSSMSGGLGTRLQDVWLFFTQRPHPARPLHGQPPPAGGWRPVALRPAYLFVIATVMFAMLITLDVLRRYSDQYGGLYFFPDTDNVSDAQSFAYNYLPIIAALVLVTLWSFIDYDVLRLEPYFQLSRPEGSPASVLFINYNFGQSFLTPLTSARRGHWIVLVVSIATLFIRMFLPALQSTLLELRELDILSDEQIKTWPELLDLHTQAVWIMAQRSNQTLAMDSVLTARDSLRSTHSASYAVAPVEITLEDRRESTVWMLNQTIYWAQLSCHNVLADDHLSVSVNDTANPSTLSWNITGVQMQDVDGTDQQCTLDFNYTNIYFPTTDYLQVRYWEPVWPNRTQSKHPQGNAFTAHGCDDPYDLYGIVISVNATEAGVDSISQLSSESTSSAGIFGCKIDYRQAEARVSMHTNSSITSIYSYPGSQRELSTDQFNIDAFQGLLAQRAPYTGDMLFIERNETTNDTTVTELPVISQDLGDLEPLLVLDASTVMTPDEFETKVTRSVVETFVLTMGRLFNPDQDPTSVPAERFSTQVAIAVVSFASWWSEMILAVGIVLTVCLIYLYGTRPNVLQNDPSSIGAMCSILTDIFGPSNVLTDPQSEFHQFSTRQLRQMLRNCQLRWQPGPTGPRLEIVTADGLPVRLGEQTRTRVDPMPHFLVIPIFIIEFLFLAAVIAVMGVVAASLAHDGRLQHLSQSSSSFLQVVTSFLPSMVASSVAALCNSILRNISILEPWVHLQRGMAVARMSLSMNYASQTPWSVLSKAIQNRHLLLGLVSFACVANILLSVVAGGLFTQRLTQSYLPSSSLYQNYSTSLFRRTDFAPDFTEFDLIQTSVTSGVPMLSWMAPNYSFVPIKNTDPDPDVLYGATTLGVGSDLDCKALQIPQDLQQEGDETYWVYRPSRDVSRQCMVNMTALVRPSEAIALSIHFLSPIAESDADLCQMSSVVVVGRWDYTAESPFTDNNTIALQCEPRLQMRNFSVTFDRRGQISDMNPLAGTAITSGAMYDNATVALGQFNKIFAAIPQSFVGEEPGRNRSYVSSYDWAGFLVARLYKQHQKIVPLQASELIAQSQIVYQWVYSTYFSIWRNMYLVALDEMAPAANATVISNTWMMVPSVPSLAMALIIIALDTLVVLVVFGTRRGRFKGPRMPRSIGAIIPWIAHSRMLNDFRNTYSWTNAQRRAHLASLNKRYGFRMFLQADGRWRFAVDEETVDLENKPEDDATKGPEAIELRSLDGLEPETTNNVI
ncbi:hypothetical protein BO70DRAFT_319458 [Aspergillus heteromorphus CBS 117.55]|uniref:Uncharacterized protein n=1 Tax=Aspergillus heteromorphus CBS 117.55 TaxID=1448321 RepID=A0A317VK42_9EURO|nr:uncharacterized protein BO70DRAFT_319458 [Aspergillus heteromorphus CBS 117.55]PWY74315.1 hypothetical protein BO70DRAFT_319458 [Aspergillus heteromorphus CBS 117.55]